MHAIYETNLSSCSICRKCHCFHVVFAEKKENPNNCQCVWRTGLMSCSGKSETCAGENMIVWKTNCCFVLCMRGEGTNKS